MRKTIGWVVVSCAAFACSSGGTTSTSSVDGGSSSGSSGDDGGATTAAQACTDRATAYCARLQSCAPGRLQQDFGDLGTCQTRTAASCNAVLAIPGNGNTPAKVEACVQAYPGWACTDFLNTENIPTACVQATGAAATGAPCGAAGQCQSGFCSIAPGSLCGTCAAAPQAGDSCAQLTSCGQTLLCTTDTQTCVAWAAQGGACGKGAPCGAGLSCVGSNATQGVQGTCQTAVAQSGATCDPTQQTGPGCDRNQGLTCNTQSKQCATLSYNAGGGPCGTNDVNAQTALCADNGVCTGATGSTTPGTCTAAAADGSACDLQNGPGCLQNSRCVAGDAGTAGTCQLPSASCQ